jgi:hypothetical protein
LVDAVVVTEVNVPVELLTVSVDVPMAVIVPNVPGKDRPAPTPAPPAGVAELAGVLELLGVVVLDPPAVADLVELPPQAASVTLPPRINTVPRAAIL